jgi:hypothetical protein
VLRALHKILLRTVNSKLPFVLSISEHSAKNLKVQEILQISELEIQKISMFLHAKNGGFLALRVDPNGNQKRSQSIENRPHQSNANKSMIFCMLKMSAFSSNQRTCAPTISELISRTIILSKTSVEHVRNLYKNF